MEIDYGFTPLNGDARRQYVNSREVFEAVTAAEMQERDYEGTMRWRTISGSDYLIRVSRRGAHRSLGLRSPETEAIYTTFFAKKSTITERLEGLRKKLELNTRLNRAQFLDRVDSTVVGVLNCLRDAGLQDNTLVIGTNSLYAYEAAAGVRIEREHLATEDLDILWDNRKRLTLATREKLQPSGLLGLLKRVDKSFELKATPDLYTAVNRNGYQVDLLRRAGPGSETEPARLSEHADDFWAVRARNVDWMLGAPKFASVIVGDDGKMAKMTTIDPRAFVLFKMWMSVQTDRDPIKKHRDKNQARLVIRLIEEYLPHLGFDELVSFPADLREAVSAFAQVW
ncbi:MAG: GSU2403 family nucleotidyltransferase fold protein [Pseudomonadota bacterium]|nr:GSU2403 family nucleotidyltransferase fold protein [Pseudomonadota bacterium]